MHLAQSLVGPQHGSIMVVAPNMQIHVNVQSPDCDPDCDPERDYNNSA